MAESPQLQRVREARATLLLTHPFFGVLSLRLDLREEPGIPTAGVDGKRLFFNPAFVDKLTQAELKGVVAHEVLHCALLHHARMENRDPRRWNIACDAALNPVLIEDGFTLPAGAIILPAFSGQTAEYIYSRLPQDAGEGGGGGADENGDGSDATGTFSSAGPEGSADAESQAREWQENVQSAIRAAQSAGKLPAHIKRIIDSTVAPRADWKALLRRFMTEHTRQRSTWARRNKRFPCVYLPGYVKEGMGAVVVGVDTSGSIGPETLSAFAAEVRAIAQDAMPSCVHVVYCDAAVNHVDSFEHGEDVVIEPHGGGGTDFRPVFDWVAEQGLTPAAFVYLTDLMGTFPDVEPEYPVLWASYGAGGAVGPWGGTVCVDG